MPMPCRKVCSSSSRAARRVPVMIERDTDFDFDALARELVRFARCRGRRPCQRVRSRARARRPSGRARNGPGGSRRPAGRRRLRADAARDAEARGHRRARGILHRKRGDDALPLLANLSRAGGPCGASPLPRCRPRDRLRRGAGRRVADRRGGARRRRARRCSSGRPLGVACAVHGARDCEDLRPRVARSTVRPCSRTAERYARARVSACAPQCRYTREGDDAEVSDLCGRATGSTS